MGSVGGQVVLGYAVEARGGDVGPGWRDITVRGQSVGLGTVDLGEELSAAELRWRCTAATASAVTLATVELYLVRPPPP